MEREPFLVPRSQLEKALTAGRDKGSNADVKRTQHAIGSHVSVTLPSGKVVAAEIVVIFAGSCGKNLLVSFDKRFMRIGPEQILDCTSAKA